MGNHITVSCCLPAHVFVMPHKKCHYFENLHYLGKFLLL